VRISPIEPFNELYYKLCFYNSIFPVIHHFNRNILSILINDINFYDFNEINGSKRLTMDYHSYQPIEAVVQTLGINAVIKKESPDIINDLIYGLNNEHPVIIWVDCYYASIRKDMYQKRHYAHTWLVYGYDKNKEIFDIIEHNHKDNLTYGKKEISFNELKDAYNGVFIHCHDDMIKDNYYEFYTNPDSHSKNGNNSDHMVMLYKNFERLKSHVLRGLNKLEDFISYFKEVYMEQEKLLEEAEALINGFNDIINAKNVELYKYKILFDEKDEKVVNVKTIIDCWTFLRNVLARYMYTGEYEGQSLKEAYDKLYNVYGIEKNLYQNFLNNSH
jgi:hypothetical protein